MMRVFLRCGLWFLSLGVSLNAFAAPVLSIEHWNTSMGVPVLFVGTHQVPVLNISVVFNAGSAEDGSNFGLAQLTAALLNEGTATLSADQIADQFSTVGAVYGADVSRDMASLSLTTLVASEQLNPALSVFHEVLTHPAFTPDSFKRLQQQQLLGIQLTAQNPGAIAANAFYHALYGDAPYGHPTEGTAVSVAALTPEKVKTFYQQYYVAKNALIILVGDLSDAQAHQVAEQLLTGLPVGNPAPALVENRVVPAGQKVSVDFPSQQSTLLVGQIATRVGDPRNYALLVGNEILGGNSLGARLYQQVRAQAGLTYGISSAFSKGLLPGPFVIQVQTRHGQTQQVLDKVEDTLQTFLQEGPSIAEVNAAKQRLIGQFPLGFANNSQMLGLLAYLGFYHLPLDYLDTYRDKIAAVTPAQVQQVFNEVVQLNHLTVVQVGSHE